MPIFDVELVLGEGEVLGEGLSTRLAKALGEALGAPAGSTWVRVRALPAWAYAENGSPPEHTPSPVFVTVLQAEPPSGEDLEAQIQAITAAVCRACGRPAEHIHTLIEPPARGRIAFGGRLRR